MGTMDQRAWSPVPKVEVPWLFCDPVWESMSLLPSFLSKQPLQIEGKGLRPSPSTVGMG